MTADTVLESQISTWRTYMLHRRTIHDTDVDELEDHLRGRITDLTQTGLESDEAFLIAVKRMGGVNELSREFAREHSERLWKQLMLTADPDEPTARGRHSALKTMLVCAGASALAIKIPSMFGITLSEHWGFLARNLGIFALAPLAAYFLTRRRAGTGTIAAVTALFALGAIAANVYPLTNGDHTTVLTAIHLPIALWLAVGVAYAAGDWRSQQRRMDFIRFTGEWCIYMVLIALGGGVLAGITAGTFAAIGVDSLDFLANVLIPCGGVAAVVVTAWLVEAKQSVIENMAPVLTRVFTPLFTATLLAVVGAILITNNGVTVEREVLILFDLLLVVVLGLLLYSISARDPLAPPGIFDWMQLALIVSALLIDILGLVAMSVRLSDSWGFTPNRSAALGENIILFVNLAVAAWLVLGLVRARIPFARLERWQTNYLVVFAAWAWVVAFVFPPVFGFA
ncbi:MAG: permease prefix domain 1-containing protein [Stackebrandtia sp.]